MQDRTPIYPGRVKLTPVSGQANTYDMERADNPTQVGTAINKANLLKDSTAAMYGLDSTAVPDDAFVASVMANTGYIHVTTKTETGVVAGIPIMIDGVYAGKTGANGKARISVPFGAHTVKVVRPMDIASVTPETYEINVTDANAIVLESNCVLSTATEATISTSGEYGFSDRVSDFDVCVVGGGGGGSARSVKSTSYAAASGGGGGYVVSKLKLLAKNFNCFLASIGAGGIGGTAKDSAMSGTDGGASSVVSQLNGDKIEALGGKAGTCARATPKQDGGNGGSGGGAAQNNGAAGAGGTNGGNGGDAKSASATVKGGTGQGTTTCPFGDTSKTPLSPGGGAAAANDSGGGAAGTAQSGGSPGVYSSSDSVTAVSGTIMGAGGGSAVAHLATNTATAANGTDGGILLRWRYKSS